MPFVRFYQASVEESHKGHVAVVVVPVVLVVLIAAILATWQLRREYSQHYLVWETF